MSATWVYIGRLRGFTGEREIEDFFRGFGKIKDIIMKQGFAFVEFEDKRDAGDAVYELSGKTLDGYRVIVDHARSIPNARRFDDPYSGSGRSGGRDSYSGGRDSYSSRPPIPRRSPPPRKRRRSRSLERSDHRIIVKNLSSRISWQDLKDIFRPVGDVVYTDAHGKRKNEGVVEFAKEKDMRKALDTMNGKDVNGKKIELVEEKLSDRPGSRSGSSRSVSPADKYKGKSEKSMEKKKRKSNSPSASGSAEAPEGKGAKRQEEAGEISENGE